jgi:Protein of unknown function (DUF2628)
MTSALDYLGPRPRRVERGRSKRPPLFDAPDQYRVRAELATFFGPNADLYVDTYDKMRSEGKTFTRTWCWPVFFGSFVWFFYRKMYGAAAVVIFVPMLLKYLVGGMGVGSIVFFAMSAKCWYVSAAMARIAKADRLGLKGSERMGYLQRAGGVSLTAGVLAGFVFVGALLFVASAVVARRHIGH